MAEAMDHAGTATTVEEAAFFSARPLGCKSTEECEGTDMDTLSPEPNTVGVISAAEVRMFQKVLTSDRTIKSQQRGEPDLTNEEKTEILVDILHRTPGAFLMRFGSLLDEVDMRCFDSSEDYEVRFRVRELRKALPAGSQQKKIRNRRYECLKELTESTSYFTEEEMRNRNPLSYEYYIGQYLTEEEREAMESNKVEVSLSALIMKNMEVDRRAQLLKRQRNYESGQLEEIDGSGGEDEDEKEYGSAMKLSVDPNVAAQEKNMLRQEFLRTMQLSFLSGEDRDFDYSRVDSNERYDSMDMRQQDEEEAYFDKEEPQWYVEGGTDPSIDGSGGGDCHVNLQTQWTSTCNGTVDR